MLYSSLNQYLLFSDQMLKQKTVKGLQQIDSVKKVWSSKERLLLLLVVLFYGPRSTRYDNDLLITRYF